MSKSFYEIHFTGEGFRTLQIYRLFLQAALAEVKQRQAERDREVVEWYTTGDGRPPEWVTEVSCGNCGAPLHAGRAPLQSPEVWYASGPNGRFCPDVDGQDHEPAFHRVNVGGKGHRYPYCRHGVSTWTDRDIPCDACEFGDDSVIVTVICMARERFLRFNQRWDWYTQAPGDLPVEVRHEVERWTLAAFPGATRENYWRS